MVGIYSDVRKAIRKAAIGSLLDFFPTTVSQDKAIIFSNNSGSEPAESYVVINILSIEQQGHASTSTQTATDFNILVQAHFEILVQFSFIGSLSGDMAQSFTQRINNNPLSLEAISRNKLGLMRKSQIRRAPQKRDTKWVEYHNMDVTFNYIVNTEQVVDWFDSIIVDSNLTDVFTIPEGVVIP